MAVVNLGDFPLDPQAVDGSELAARLNRLFAAIVSTSLSPTRPPELQKGGLWAKDNGPTTQPDIFLFDGTDDITVAGGQMYGRAKTKAIFFNSNEIAENITVKAGENGGTFGPVTINDGFTVTVENGSVWSVV